MKNTVLVIDDDPTVVDMIRTMLLEQGYQVLIARDGQSGIWEVKTRQPDLIICDLLLPRGHGFDLLQKIKGNPLLMAIPMILMTAVYKSQQYKRTGKNYGAEAFIEKPLDPDELLDIVRRLLPLPGKNPVRSPELLQKKLTQLKSEFISKLPSTIDRITDCCGPLINGDWDTDTARTLHLTVHRLIGSGGNLKLNLLHGTAGRMESYLDTLLESGTAPATEECEDLRRLLSNLRTATDEEIRDFEAQEGADSFALVHRGESPVIFLVEDDLEQSRYLALHLEHFGYTPRCITSPSSFRCACSAELPAAILMDIIFPNAPTAGIEAVETLRKERGSEIPVIFISSSRDPEIRLAAYHAGGDAYLTKPVDITELADNLKQLAHKQISP